MGSIKRVTIHESNKSNYMERFDKVRGPVPRSKGVIKVLQFLIEYDPNYLRNILGLNPLADSELYELKAMALPHLAPQTPTLMAQSTEQS